MRPGGFDRVCLVGNDAGAILKNPPLLAISGEHELVSQTHEAAPRLKETADVSFYALLPILLLLEIQQMPASPSPEALL